MDTQPDNTPLNIEYTFRVATGQTETVSGALDPKTIRSQVPAAEP